MVTKRFSKYLAPGLTWSPPVLCALIFVGCGDEQKEALEPDGFRGLADGLELHWSFDDSVDDQITDLSGKGRHGTLQAGAALVASPNGQAVSLDGVDDYVALVGPRSPALYGGADGSFTLSARVKLADAERYNTLCYGCGPFSFMYAGTGDYGAALMSAFDDQASANNKKWALSDPVLDADDWTQVTLVVEDGASARYYVDCALSGQLDDADIGLEDPGFSAVGLSGSPDRWFQGEIDELRVWSRVLSDTELAELCPAPTLTDDLELHWSVEDRVGDQITDLSGNGRHGTNIGGAFVSSPTGEALSLDGVDDKVAFPGPRALALYGGEQGDFTISAKLKLADANRYNSLCFGCGPFKFWYAGDPNPGGQVLANFKDLSTQGNLWTASNSILQSGEWAELTLVVEGGAEVRTYHDCALDSTAVGEVGLVDTGYSVIGESSNPGWWFGGEIDELRIWSRALSEAELPALCPRALCDGPIYVDVDAPPGGDGTSWPTAFDTVQGALDAAAVCDTPQLWLAEGQYGTNIGWYVATLDYPVELYGGFSGVETSLAERDVATHDTRLGGDDWERHPLRIMAGAVLDPDSQTRIDGIRISGGIRGAILVVADPHEGTLIFDQLTITDNFDIHDGVVEIVGTGSGSIEIRNSLFARNRTSKAGGAMRVHTSGVALSVTNSTFEENDSNSAGWGGAMFIEDASQVSISDCDFNLNKNTLWHEDDPETPEQGSLTITDSTFTNNSGTIRTEESSVHIDGCLFNNNTSDRGGAFIAANVEPDIPYGSVVIEDCRFVGNQAVVGGGGAICVEEDHITTVINSEFIGNQATTVGGAVLARGQLVSCSFTGNSAPNGGSALYAFSGTDMTMDHCVAYPDTVAGPNIFAPNSCITANPALNGAPLTLLGADPFEPADLDLDGLTELYLDPQGPCAAFDGAVIDEYDWAALTTDLSQCTDSGWPDPGVHHPPQSAVGPCP